MRCYIARVGEPASTLPIVPLKRQPRVILQNSALHLNMPSYWLCRVNDREDARRNVLRSNFVGAVLPPKIDYVTFRVDDFDSWPLYNHECGKSWQRQRYCLRSYPDMVVRTEYSVEDPLNREAPLKDLVSRSVLYLVLPPALCIYTSVQFHHHWGRLRS